MRRAVVLDPEIAYAELGGQTVGADERGEAGVTAGDDVARDRKQLAIAPHARRPGGDRLARHAADERIDVGADIERPEADLTDMKRTGRILTSTLPAREAGCYR